MPRELISETASERRYRVTDDSGAVIGEDVESIPTTEQANEVTLRDRARTALVSNANFLGLSSPTSAQVVTQVQRLTRQSSALIRLEIGALDSVTDA